MVSLDLPLAMTNHAKAFNALGDPTRRAIVSPLGYNREWKGSTPTQAVAHALKMVEV